MKKTIFILSGLILMSIIGGKSVDNKLSNKEKNEGWELLFDGIALNGWHDYNGDSLTGPWGVEDGAIKAEGHGNDANGYIVTNRQFDNFILSWDWKISKGGNSGMMYHVVQNSDYEVPYATGPEYQLIDNINFDGKLEEWQKCGADYAMYLPDSTKLNINTAGEWNNSQIVFDNGHVEYWMNGQKTLEFESWSPDWYSRKSTGKWKNFPDYGEKECGVICLQDHGYPAWFKNIKIKQLPKNKKEEWLFDGTSTDAWRSVSTDSFPQTGWEVNHNKLIVKAQEGNIPAGADIITVKKYANFILELDYKLTTHANSGVKYFVVDNYAGYEGQFLGLEYQIIDDDSYSEEELGNSYGNHKTGSVYELIPAPAKKKMNAPGEWNHVKLMVDCSHVEHWLNGQKMLEYERGSDAFKALVAKSKYTIYPKFGEAPRGHIMLQGHNGEVAFRQIKIVSW
ncbi:MAG: DUF1080 domain-containing protein [Bacteroidales bacterium]|nr:DUF1080 domain-containing protein [Bacteroidales bacterium]